MKSTTMMMTGAMSWVQTLSWPGLAGYNSAVRRTLTNPDTQLTEAFVKAHDRLKFYWILGAGHSVGGLSMLPHAICRWCSITDRPSHAHSNNDNTI